MTAPALEAVRVQLWSRHQPPGESWGSWSLADTQESSPFTFSLGAGPGDYEFYTRAEDNAANVEEAPGVADAATTLPTGAVDLYGPTVMTDGPQAYWRLGEASGTTAVDETTDYTGSYHGSASLGEDGLLVSEADTAVEFDGSSSYVTSGVDSPLSFASTGKKSFEAWIAPTGDNPTETVVFRGSSGHGYDYWVWWEDDEIWVNLWTSGGSDRIVTSSGADTVPDDETSHIVVTLDDATDKVEFYVNGVLVRTVTTSWFSSSSSQGTDPLVIGRRNDDSSAYFDGVIDEVALYSKVLSQGQRS